MGIKHYLPLLLLPPLWAPRGTSGPAPPLQPPKAGPSEEEGMNTHLDGGRVWATRPPSEDPPRAPAEWTTRQRVDRVHSHPSPPSRAVVTSPYRTSGLPGSFKYAQVLPSKARISSRYKVKVAQLYPTLCSPMDSSMEFSRPEYWSG